MSKSARNNQVRWSRLLHFDILNIVVMVKQSRFVTLLYSNCYSQNIGSEYSNMEDSPTKAHWCDKCTKVFCVKYETTEESNTNCRLCFITKKRIRDTILFFVGLHRNWILYQWKKSPCPMTFSLIMLTSAYAWVVIWGTTWPVMAVWLPNFLLGNTESHRGR